MSPSSTTRPQAIGALILAAGSSSRLGQAKQLLTLDGLPLVVRAARAALEAGLAPVAVVVGAHAEAVTTALRTHTPTVLILPNANWENGMGSSIAAGTRQLLAQHAALDGLLIAVCDQPRFCSATVTALVHAWRGRSHIACASYETKRGVPALFGAEFFAKLQALSGPSGARALLDKHAAQLSAVTLPALAFDIDTASDWRAATGEELPS